MAGRRIALIGCGRVGSQLEDDPLRGKPASHMGGIKRLGDMVDLVAICDIDRERLITCQERWQVRKIYLDYKELLLQEKPEVAIIATWTSSHRDIAVYAIEHGVQAIVLEKPLATDLKQAEEIVRVCRKAHVPLVVNHERRWHPLYLKTLEIIRAGELGKLKTIYANVLSQSYACGDWQTVLDTVGGGPLLHDGTHLVDMIRMLAGEIATVHGAIKREDPDSGTETTAYAMLQAQSGVMIFLEAGGMRQYFNFELDLHFEKGRIGIGNGIMKYFTSTPSSLYSGFCDLKEETFPAFSYDRDPFSGALLEALHALDSGEEPLSSGEDGVKAMEIIFAIYYSAYLNGKPIDLPLRISGHPLKKIFQSGGF